MSERFWAWLARRLSPYIVAFIAIEVDRQQKARDAQPKASKPFIGARKNDADRDADP